MKVGSLFAGIGGFDLAAESAGMEIAFQSEVDKYSSVVLEHHWPNQNLGDIHDITGTTDIDVLTGGFPCQSYSVAGQRGGLLEDRGALWWEFHRLISEGQPEWVVGENVPGLLSSAGGRDFATIIRSLVQLGYGVVWRVLDAQYFGVPQRRRRVFIVAHSGGQPRPEILTLAQGLSGDPKSSRPKRKDIAATLTGGFGSGGADENSAQGNHLIPNAMAFNAHQDPDVLHEQSPPLLSSTRSANAIGVTTARKLGFGHYIEDDKASTITQRDYKSSTDLIAFAQNQRAEVRDLNNVAGALAADPGMKQQTYVMNAAQDPITTEDMAQPIDVNVRHSQALFRRDTVRRLTPLECERLQGFPDYHTAIPNNSDTQRYRQLGNAVAVPVVSWIMKNIAEA